MGHLRKEFLVLRTLSLTPLAPDDILISVLASSEVGELNFRPMFRARYLHKRGESVIIILRYCNFSQPNNNNDYQNYERLGNLPPQLWKSCDLIMV
jgi:hypothetical protein